MDYAGVIIAESLQDADVLSQVDIMDTVVEPVTPEHETPWLSQWTLHTVRVPDAKAREIAEVLSHSIDAEHSTSWYADFQNDTHHFVVFRAKVFHIDRRSREQYDEAVAYGVSRGLPEHQADFVNLIED
jgi:hypothetical protein